MLPTSCLSVFHHLAGLSFKGLKTPTYWNLLPWKIFIWLKHKININSTGVSYQHYLNEVSNHILLSLDNVKKLESTWKEIKNILLKLSNYTSNAIIDSNADPTAVANASKNYFSTTALYIQSSIRYLKKTVFWVFTLNKHWFIFYYIDTIEISSIISSLDVYSSVGLNSIVPSKVLKQSFKQTFI